MADGILPGHRGSRMTEVMIILACIREAAGLAQRRRPGSICVALTLNFCSGQGPSVPARVLPYLLVTPWGLSAGAQPGGHPSIIPWVSKVTRKGDILLWPGASFLLQLLVFSVFC